MLQEIKDKKKSMEETIARWLAAHVFLPFLRT
ncbi:hypothetical protein EC991775_1120, partial [Escherichia coli 99.1775]